MIKERYDIAIERIKEIITEDTVEEKFLPYFVAAAQFILKIDNLLGLIESKKIEKLTLEQLTALNKDLYEDETEIVYGKCFANPKFAVEKLGEEYGQLLCYVFTTNRNMISNAFQGKLEEITLRMELFIEIYNQFEDRENLTKKSIHDIIYSFEKDNSEIFMTNRIDEIINPENDFAVKIVMESDLEDLRYLYKYGESISENEIETAKFLNTLSQEKIDKIASVYTEGYRLGFINTGKDLSIKSAVDIRYYIGFERIIRAAIKQFENMGLKPVIYKGGYESTKINKQYWFDHKFDDALFFDKGYVQRKLEVATTAFENRKKTAALMAGPAVIEVFGENPFEPENKKEALQLNKEQQKLKVEYAREYTQIVQKYIKGDERSFTIIAFPLPEIGMDYEELFEETVKINCLDQDKYRKVQQSIIDALDKADFVRVEGKGSNKTYITVNMHELKNPEKETNFENCLADVNIPLGEVFTSPKLTGTNGVLHVSQVYLNELKYNDLEITFENGCIKDYTCKNFDTEEENKKYIKENVMFNHDTLPIGEFAIGTNTTAYVMANKYDIVYKLPILIVEKMGPHFAVGDTCYSWEEDVKTFNPDGKEIVAKENEISALRNEDLSKAYFSCHTDITIPYDELGEITAVTKNGEEIVIIKDGRFVLPGTELLNEAFDK
ncbi:leucyl aminopeptidase [Eubacterium sp. AF17-7]|uniref:aminopeptidase n=1 Tax=Eubacterium sp. AF17-7 TaxID=2293105 RepID=UPI000E4A573A|nr:aminopeptidase [Eubacterium sp. AF17-7]RGG67532.1 leucyl aminopeptidase [Eubacterium sp. AF17-7]